MKKPVSIFLLLLAGCTSGPLTTQNRISCTLSGDQMFFDSFYGGVAITVPIAEPDSWVCRFLLEKRYPQVVAPQQYRETEKSRKALVSPATPSLAASAALPAFAVPSATAASSVLPGQLPSFPAPQIRYVPVYIQQLTPPQEVIPSE